MPPASDTHSPGPGRGRSPLRSVLAATDLSDAAAAALVSAATLADAAGADVHAVHCIKRPGPFGAWDEEEESARLSAAAAALRQQVAKTRGHGPEPSTEVVVAGRPAAEINARVRSVAADLVVLGPGRRRFPGATLLGSTTDRVIRTSRVPCLLANAPLRTPPRTVLLATDFSPPAARARDVIAGWLRGFLGEPSAGAPPPSLVVLCVSAFGDRTPPPTSPAALLDAEMERIRAKLGTRKMAIQPVVYSAALVLEGIRHVAHERDADLVVVGTHGYNPLSRMLVGSVATAVAAHLDRAILVVPPQPPHDAAP